MRYQIFFLTQLLIISTKTFGQKFELGTRIQPNIQLFTQIDYSPSMKVHTYKYVGKIKDKYLFDKRVSEILIGVKNGVIVTTIYNLKLINEEHKIEKSTLKKVNKVVGKELLFVPHNSYAITIGNKFVSLRICNTPLTFDQPRMVYLTTIKYSILIP